MASGHKNVILILGAGFGGLRATKKIAKELMRLDLFDRYEIVLVDRNDYHTYTPTLYEVATTSKETADTIKLKSIVTFPIKKLIARLPVNFIKAEVQTLDLINGDVHLSSGRKMKFDYLVLALGSETNYFNIPGLKEHALPLKSFDDAIKIREALSSYKSSSQPLKVVIGGGGSTGVELGAEIMEWACEMQEKKVCSARVTIIEAGKTILGGFESSVISLAEERLKKLGVEILANEVVEAVKDGFIILKSGKNLPYDVFIWAGGVKVTNLLAKTPLKRELKGRVEVKESLECLLLSPDLSLHGKVYSLGDMICFYNPSTKRPIPGVARAALVQANIVAHNIIEDIRAAEKLSKNIKHKIYWPLNYPYIIPVGGKYAVAKVGPFVIKGFIAWIFKGLVEFFYLSSIMPLREAIKIWLTGLRIFIQNDRLG